VAALDWHEWHRPRLPFAPRWRSGLADAARAGRVWRLRRGAGRAAPDSVWQARRPPPGRRAESAGRRPRPSSGCRYCLASQGVAASRASARLGTRGHRFTRSTATMCGGVVLACARAGESARHRRQLPPRRRAPSCLDLLMPSSCPARRARRPLPRRPRTALAADPAVHRRVPRVLRRDRRRPVAHERAPARIAALPTPDARLSCPVLPGDRPRHGLGPATRPSRLRAGAGERPAERPSTPAARADQGVGASPLPSSSRSRCAGRGRILANA
jgi:hypothetical protein